MSQELTQSASASANSLECHSGFPSERPPLPCTRPLTGRQLAWFKVYMMAVSAKDTALFTRGNGRGIAVDDDKHARVYQLACHRQDRAYLALTGWPAGCPVQVFDLIKGKDVTDDELKGWWKRWRAGLARIRKLKAQARAEWEAEQDVYE